jgi:hypothetical protein
MQSSAATPVAYLAELPADRQEAMSRLRQTILDHLPEGFTEVMNYGMIGYAVPFSKYPAGYHCDPKQPLPFISIASQKNYMALYHMGIYADQGLLEWFTNEYPKHSKTKLDIGKSCIRFKKPDQIPYQLIAELCGKMSADRWVELYEKYVKR